MTIALWQFGKTDKLYQDIEAMFQKRISRYIKFETTTFPEGTSKVKAADGAKQWEAEKIKSLIKPGDVLVLLDEKGKQYTSRAFAEQLNKWMVSGPRRLVFIIGGAYGFSEELKQHTPQQFSLSKGTFSHQIVRGMFLEQLYRAFTILNNEPYHND